MKANQIAGHFLSVNQSSYCEKIFGSVHKAGEVQCLGQVASPTAKSDSNQRGRGRDREGENRSSPAVVPVGVMIIMMMIMLKMKQRKFLFFLFFCCCSFRITRATTCCDRLGQVLRSCLGCYCCCWCCCQGAIKKCVAKSTLKYSFNEPLPFGQRTCNLTSNLATQNQSHLPGQSNEMHFIIAHALFCTLTKLEAAAEAETVAPN